MLRFRSVCVPVVLVALVPGIFASAQAQSRVFVSGTGDDSGSCTLAAPCRTFQRAHNVVGSGGEIVPLNSAGYGPVTISKSLSIAAPDGIYAGVTSNGDGINIHGSGIQVYLRGLSIIGTGANDSIGIFFDQGDRLVVDRCRISGFIVGVLLNVPSGSPTLVMNDSVVDRNSFRGVELADGNVSLQRCTITGSEMGVSVYGGTNLTIRDTSVTKCWDAALRAYLSGEVALFGCTFSANGDAVVVGNAAIKLVGTAITGNTRGLFRESGTTGQGIFSGGGNLVSGNGTNGLFNGSADLQ